MNFELIRMIEFVRHGGIGNHPLLASLDAQLRATVAKRFCYLPGHSVCYLRIPKAANSSISKTLALHAFGRKAIEADITAQRSKSWLRRMPTSGQFKESFSFTFVREPASRVLSAYLDKGHNPKYQKTYDLLDPSNSGAPISFSHFLGRLEEGLLHKDLHWIPQSAMIPEEGRNFTHIGRMENLDQELPEIMRKTFGRFENVSNKERGRTQAAGKTGTHVSMDDRARIERLYARDYELYFSGH